MMKRMAFYAKTLIILFALSLFFQAGQGSAAGENHDELFVLIGDSLMKAKDGDKETITANMNQFSADWKAIKDAGSKQAGTVDKKVKEVNSLLAEDTMDEEGLARALSSLSSALAAYDKQQNPADEAAGMEQVKKLLPVIADFEKAAENPANHDLSSFYGKVMMQWTASEKFVHDKSIASYGNIERHLALIRISITQEPADLAKADRSLKNLHTEVENFIAGKSAKQVKGDYSLSDVFGLLNEAEEQIAGGQHKDAVKGLNKLLTIWPMVEGDVQTRDSGLYSDMETRVPAALSLLNSKKVDAEKAGSIVGDLGDRLAPLLKKTSYSSWDSALILLREGLEGLLIVALLLSFLKQMGQGDKQKWIWTGVAAGVFASAILAIVIHMLFSSLTAASSREYIEGLIGLLAVIMMLTVGVWLHKKSNIGSWNRYIKQQMNQAVAKGSLLSFAVISFLSVFREGAETIIFYTGITPYISMQQLVTGIVVAVIILAGAGYAIISYSVKIPVRIFFRAATLLIYVLAFKILGVSIHALQISKVFPTTTVTSLPFIEPIGFYPTLETAVTQVLLLLIIGMAAWLIRKKETAGAVAAK
ncbi:FTR1 family protein [Peribacillus sp. SCS-37]|uniref:FTR1 family iron permease n=1 Tax=Paraperibacillus esterisolvens TaxID=3115296 RepID=UPI0039067C47